MSIALALNAVAMDNNTFLYDVKYATLLSSRVRNFKSRGNYLFNFSCPVCGDSQTNKRKARFYIYPEGRKRLKVKCHKCQYNNPLWLFLKEHVPDLYTDYRYETFEVNREQFKPDPILNYTKPKRELVGGVLKGLKRISQLAPEHKAKQYIVGRKIPTPTHARLYFTLNFSKWINTLVPGKFEKTPDIDPRIVIPLIDRNGKVFAVQGRGLLQKQQRYITIKFDEDMPKIYGLDRVDPNLRTYVLEGPIDSEFIPNAIAMTGADCSMERVVELVGCDKDRIVVVMDNSPRNPNVVKQMGKYIAQGYKVCIWPKTLLEKDVNDMVKAGMAPADIHVIIDKHTFGGLQAELELASWRKDGQQR